MKHFKNFDDDSKLPPILTYSNLLLKAHEKYNISLSECRKKYGQFTLKEWKEILN